MTILQFVLVCSAEPSVDNFYTFLSIREEYHIFVGPPSLVYQPETHVDTRLDIEAPKIVVKLEGYLNLLKIGKGGMVHGYRCIQNPLQRPAAIKLLINELSSDAKARKRFERESYIIARLNLANIIRVINRGSTGDEISYSVMQFVEGIDLGSAMKSRQLGHGQKVDIIVQILKALAHTHRNNVIHRDISCHLLSALYVLKIWLLISAKKTSRNLQDWVRLPRSTQ